jgi:hypothetical protein
MRGGSAAEERPERVWTTPVSTYQSYKHVGVPNTRVLGHSGDVPKKNQVPGGMRRETLEQQKSQDRGEQATRDLGIPRGGMEVCSRLRYYQAKLSKHEHRAIALG